jgi:phosphoglycerate dehydrogenase-like enzyme
MKTQVLSTENFNEIQLARLRAVSDRLEVRQCPCHNPEEVARALDGEVEVLCGYYLPPDISIASDLRWAHISSAAVSHVLDHPIMDSDILITNASGVHATAVAEYVLAMMLNLVRRLPQILSLQWGHGWPSDRHFAGSGGELRGQTIGIIGYGSIGREVARLASAFGMRVLAAKRNPEDRADRGYCPPGLGDPEGIIPEVIYGADGLPEMLPACDFVVVAVALTPETRSLIGAAALRMMKSTAYLINVARGPIVDEEALIEALRIEQIAGATLDVYSHEPLPSDHPLWMLPNVFLTPHISGGSTALNGRASILFAENLRRYLAGEPLLNIVNKEIGY